MTRAGRIFSWTVAVTLLVVLLTAIVSSIDTQVWWLDLPSQFRWHAFAFFGLSLVLLSAGCVRMNLTARRNATQTITRPIGLGLGLAIVGTLITGYGIAWASAPGLPLLDLGDGSGEMRIRIVHFNLGTRADGDWRNVIEWLQQQPADVIFLQETRPDFEQALDASPLADKVALRNVRPDSRGTIALVLGNAKLINARLDVETLNETDRALARVEVRVGQDTCTLLSMHMCRPTSAVEFAKQSYEIEQLGGWFGRERGGVAVGDINCAAYSPRLAAMLREHELRATTAGTWPAGLPSVLSLPIDVLVTDQFKAIESQVAGPNLGSDHRPLVVTVRLSS